MIDAQRRSSEESATQTRCKLIEATQQLLATGGTDALTSRAIAATAGANLASITYYFGSKQQLVVAAMIATARDLLAPVITALSSDDEPTAKMLQSVVLLNKILDEHRNDLAAYLQVLAASPINPSIATAVRALHRDMAQLLAEQIALQRAAEELPSWVSPDAMAQLIVAVVHGTLVTALVDPDQTNEVAIGAQLTQLLLCARITPQPP